MRVRELIERLKDCNPDALVVLDGHSDSGFDDYTLAYEVERVSVTHEQSWRGSHVSSKDGSPAVHIH